MGQVMGEAPGMSPSRAGMWLVVKVSISRHRGLQRGPHRDSATSAGATDEPAGDSLPRVQLPSLSHPQRSRRCFIPF